MQTERVAIPSKVLEGIEAVRVSGKTNMLDVPVVKKLAHKMGRRAAAEWIDEHVALYYVGVFRGFEATDEGGDA